MNNEGVCALCWTARPLESFVLQKTLVQTLLSASLSAASQEKQLNPQGGN